MFIIIILFLLFLSSHDAIGGGAVSSSFNKKSLLLSLSGNSTLLSPNHTFALGIFTVDGESNLYLGIWYASIPIRTYVWVANRRSPIKPRSAPAAVTITTDGKLGLLTTTSKGKGSLLWSTDNSSPATEATLLDTGNLLLLDSTGNIVWQSFDFPADTWLPNMNVTNLLPLVSWRSPSDPSPGIYSLRLRPPDFGEFELVFNDSINYWSTGNWTGNRFAGVPEMTVPYFYSFRFFNPFTPDASFVYSETPPPPELSIGPLLSRFAIDSSGQLMQYTWSSQAASWNVFWSRPENACQVYGRCGSLGFCTQGLRPCECLAGLHPLDPGSWNSGDFSGGCALAAVSRGGGGGGGNSNSDSDSVRFNSVGSVDFDGASTVSIPGIAQESCENSCRGNCSCFGIKYDSQSRLCQNLYGNAYNLRNSTTAAPILYVKIASPLSDDNDNKKGKLKITVIVSTVCCFLGVLMILTLILLLLKWRRKKCKQTILEKEDEEGYPAVTNLRVFTYKELSASTNSFSEKVGHGGFGAVFRGEISDSILVAVKRLERPGGGDREFRAEVRTIGNIQHVNLVRLRGFCCEESHRLLVYDYMPNGPLSAYLTRRDGNQRPPLSWQSRFQIAMGTARGIAYLHEECRECIIHCDVKPENILLDVGYIPKVADFGLAKLMGRDLSRVLATMRGTWGYVAPEWISGVAITAKADVYSYGMTLLEILGGRRNVEAQAPGACACYEEGDDEEGGGWFFPPWAARRIIEGDVSGVVDPNLGGEYDRAEAERAGLVAVWCIQDEEGARPTMGAVVNMLQGTVAVSTPPLPKLLQALVSGGDSFTPSNGNGMSKSNNNSSGGGEIKVSQR